jgi:Acyl-CoA synthetases (AMP-forming)/AMP-acid ligases II
VQKTPKTQTLAELIALRAAENGPAVAYRFLPDGEHESLALTYAELERQVRALAAVLAEHTTPGDRALILAPDADDFIRGFLACQYAGLIAVPVYPPMPFTGRPGTLGAIARDCAPAVVLAAVAEDYRRFVLDGAPELARVPWIDATAPDPARLAAAEGFTPLPRTPEDISFLQYTSGSTALPKGVMVTNSALMHQEELLHEVGEFSTESVIVTWLPLFHDMGLIGNVLAGLYAGCQTVVMPPLAFVKRPIRWLRAISTYRATVSGGPNFAYELCVRRVRPQERDGLDLSSLRIAFNGAEPIRAATLEAFAETYRPYGFDERAIFPCYGLAEATLMGTGSYVGGGAVTLDVDRVALQEGRLVKGGGHRIVGSGVPRVHRRLEIVDPDTRLRVPPGTVGEIWLAGPDITAGYWARPDETEYTFNARIADTGEGPFLRTGDLGVLDGDQLYVTGRIKDLIIVAGRNLYPQDIEATAETAHPLIRQGCVAAFGAELDGEERLVVVAEIKPARDEEELAEVRAAVRQAVAAAHAVRPEEVVLVRPGAVPKTSSGKLQRRACRAAWANERLPLAGVASLGAAR